MRKINLLLLIPVFLSLISCLSIETKKFVDFRKKPLKSDASYIYGKFYIKGIDVNGSNYMSVGLYNEDLMEMKKIFLVGDYYIYAVEVTPGRYSIRNMYYGDKEDGLKIQDREENKPLYLFEVKKGEAVYIGDYYGKCIRKQNVYKYDRGTMTETIDWYYFEGYRELFKSTTFLLNKIYQTDPLIRWLDAREIDLNKEKK